MSTGVGVEIQNLVMVWFAAIGGIYYCYYFVTRIPSGIPRLLSLLPILYLFFILPLNISCVHLGFTTSYYLVWLANFKLLLLCFDKGPLSSYSTLPLLHFLSIALLPIKISQNTKTVPTGFSKYYLRPCLTSTVVKVMVLAVLIRAYELLLRLNLISFLHGFYLYIALEFILAITVVPVRLLLGLEIEAQFNEPYLATSLQEFWGRRWNQVTSDILRQTVYFPLRAVLSRHGLGKELARYPAILVTFLVSGLMHELIYYYLTFERPTWEVTCFFVLHGIFVCTEVAVKKKVVGWQINRVISTGFLAGTIEMAFIQIMRNGIDLKAIKECSFVKERLLLILGF